MRKFYAAIITCALLVFFAGDVFSQQTLVTAAKRQELASLSAKSNATYQASHQKAIALAKANGWIIRHKTKKGGMISLQGLNAFGLPVYLKTYDNSNVIAAATTQTTSVQPGGSLGLNLSGSSASLAGKLAIWDGGAVYAAHQEFAGKTITINTTQAVLDHSTHVAGTMIAQGVYPPAKGMAFNATTLQSYDFDNDVATMSGAASTLLLSNHSYGDEAGWNLDDEGNWEWFGLPGDTVDYTFGIYNSRTQAYDQIANSAPSYLIVESSGNARGYPGPAIGGTYYGYKSRSNGTLVQKTRTAGSNISSQQGFDGISSTGNAKDILTVGSVGALPYGPATRQSPAISYFSSFGPSDDGRVKPDICGMGEDVLSCGVTSPQAYLILSGTSMSSPNVTGSLYLLQEYYSQKNSGNFMLSATLKGLVCHTAFDAGNIGPDYSYGWGLLDMQKAAQAITDNGTKSLVKENTLTQGQTQTQQVTASGSGPLMATICWNDPAGKATADGVINDPTIKLVNDLDIRVSDGTTTFMPWVLDPTHPSAPATTGNNIRDNVEQVAIPNAVPGKIYTISISHKHTLQGGSQAYSLIVTGIGGSAYCASGPGSSADSRINNVSLSNINNTPPAGCTTYSDYTSQTVQLERGQTYPLSLTLGTCGGNFDKIAKVFIDWNGDGNFTGDGELVATSNIINGTDTYTTNITVPGTVIPGNYSLMRVVLTETSDPAGVTACGTYAKGETQDYRVQFLQTSIDAGVAAITSPGTSGTCSGSQPITIALKNYGSSTISNIPVTVTVKAPDNTVTITQTYTDTIPALAQASFTLNQNYTFTAGAIYTITAATNLSADLITSNNQATATDTINEAPVITAGNANYCDETSQYVLTGTGDGNIFWYPDNTTTVPITYGAQAFTPQAPTNNTYYAGLNDFSASVGPKTKEVFSAGGYNQFGPAVNVHAAVPVIIKSARLYIGYPGKITFTVTNNDGITVSGIVIDAAATRTSPQPGAQDDDLSDTGKVYNLNLLLPAAGDYSINIAYDNTATIYRNNGGVSGYPFTIGNIFSIVSNTATDVDPDYYKNFYYYFYDMQVQAAGCASASRLPVTVVRPVITQNGTTLSSNFASGNQWYFDGKIISGATDQTYSPTVSGKYKLHVGLITGCTDTSATLIYVAPHTGNTNDIGLVEYPVPVTASANNILNILFTAKSSDELTLSLINSIGKVVYTNKQTIAAGNFSTELNVAGQPSGIYILKLQLGQKMYANKIIISR